MKPEALASTKFYGYKRRGLWKYLLQVNSFMEPEVVTKRHLFKNVQSITGEDELT